MPRAAFPVWNSFALDRAGTSPVQEQLVRFFRDAVVRGALAPGTRVPGTRVLAQELGLARNTVALAYERLIAEGFLEARHGSGTFVPSRLPRPPARPAARAAGRRGSARALGLLAIGAPPSTPSTWPLTPGLPALDAFPRALWARLSARAWRNAPELGYADPAGLRALREALSAYLGAARGVVCRPEQVIVTSGTQEAVLIAAMATADPGERVWVEEPGYPSSRRALTLAGLTAVGVPVDEEGLDVAAGRVLAPGARLALVAPSHQYPTGVVMSLGRRLELLAWAGAADGFVVEDDYDSEFRYDGAPVPPLKALDGEDGGRVLYVGTLSKLLAPGVRLGFLVVPDRLIDAALAVRAAVSRHVAPPLQATAAAFIGDGHLGAHIRRVRPLYAERRAALLTAAAEAGIAPVTGSATGLHVLVRLPGGTDDAAVAAAARARRLGVTALSAHALAGAEVGSGLLLGFGNTPARATKQALRMLAACLEEAESGAS
ncbi:PLP-dependent aminotransferase family protein [Benzoatithermus flavus]|uniref:PLP-dependent aminotransferase family protein n=1 Tax=Benzoatithermus flavus TaxID=3108223 RepID=A0ABU8XW97_9PROT